MVVMNEAVVVMMICGLWALGAYALYQRFFIVRRLRKRLENYADAFIASSSTAHSPAPTETGEYKRLQQRLEVLERIAVEKEDSLSRQFEELRVASR